MSEWDQQALEANFQGWRTERAPDLPVDTAFERYAIEQVLKDDDLSDDEFECGLLGGGDDGGVDGFFFFINRTLMHDENDAPDPALTVELKIIQAKNQKSFSEDAVEKLNTFARDLLDYSKPTTSLMYYNQSVRDAIDHFRDKYVSVLGSHHSLSVTFYYVSKADADPHPKLGMRANGIRETVAKQLSAAKTTVEFWGCTRLLTAARTVPKTKLTLDFARQLSTDDGSVVCLANLKSYAAFLTDEAGGIRRSLLEPNVRDYQGKRNPVNVEIRKTLRSGSEEFWWLNNGVTVVAQDCNISGNKLSIDMPEIVNGLQTSEEIHAHFLENPSVDERRHILIRVILPKDERTRNQVTKATNNQTPVSALSLKATDQIHFDIEEMLRLHDLFYDRRKGQYRNQRKPIAKIVSIKSLAQSVLSVLLLRPNDAYGGPLKVLKQEDWYEKIFSESYDRSIYAVCALLDATVSSYVNGRDDLSREQRRGLKYYVMAWLGRKMTGVKKPTVGDLVALKKQIIDGIDIALLDEGTNAVFALYKDLGGTDRVAKGPQMADRLLAT